MLDFTFLGMYELHFKPSLMVQWQQFGPLPQFLEGSWSPSLALEVFSSF